MDPDRRRAVFQKMKEHITNKGQEERMKILNQAQNETDVEKKKYIDEERRYIAQEYQTKLSQDEIKLRI
jgi:hypothetical protein